MMTPPARSLEERTRDTRHRLEHDVDAWVATADAAGGAPYLIPLSFSWDGQTLLFATPRNSVTGRNIRETGKVRLGLGATRDVVLIEGTAQPLGDGELGPEEGDVFAARTGFDPRQLSQPYLYFRVAPRRIQAWQEENELTGRELMRDGRWLVD